jgi:hypothetical protein
MAYCHFGTTPDILKHKELAFTYNGQVATRIASTIRCQQPLGEYRSQEYQRVWDALHLIALAASFVADPPVRSQTSASGAMSFTSLMP